MIQKIYIREGQTLTDLTFSMRDLDALTEVVIEDTPNVTDISHICRNSYSLETFTVDDDSLKVISGIEASFLYCVSLQNIDFLGVGRDTSEISTLYNTFYRCTSLTTIPVFDTSRVTTFANAWRECSGLTSFPSGFDFSSALNVGDTWHDCSSLTSFPVINSSNIGGFSNAWDGCSSLTSFPLIDMSGITTTSGFSHTWDGCSSLTSFPPIDLSEARSLFWTWHGCSSLTSFTITGDLLKLFTWDSTSNGLINTWDGCSSLTSFSFGTTQVALVDWNFTFSNCTSLVCMDVLPRMSQAFSVFSNSTALVQINYIDTTASTYSYDLFLNTSLQYPSISYQNILDSDWNGGGIYDSLIDEGRAYCLA